MNEMFKCEIFLIFWFFFFKGEYKEQVMLLSKHNKADSARVQYGKLQGEKTSAAYWHMTHITLNYSELPTPADWSQLL